MRSIHGHTRGGMTSNLKIFAADTPGASGANQRYVITGFDTTTNVSRFPNIGEEETDNLVILFQNGDPKIHGDNGITIEALLAIAADRLQGFQEGLFPCDENANALMRINQALHCLEQRTLRFTKPKEEE